MRAVEEKDLPRPRIAVGYFPNVGEDSTEKILTYVRGQNKGLDTKQWRILNRKTLDAMTCITVSVSSAKILENSSRVNFKFREAKIIIKKNRSLEEAKSGAAAAMEVEAPEDASVPLRDETASGSRPPPSTSSGQGSQSLEKDVQQKPSTAAQGGSNMRAPERRDGRQENRAFRPPLQKKESKASSNPHLPSRKGPRGGRRRR